MWNKFPQGIQSAMLLAIKSDIRTQQSYTTNALGDGGTDFAVDIGDIREYAKDLNRQSQEGEDFIRAERCRRADKLTRRREGEVELITQKRKSLREKDDIGEDGGDNHEDGDVRVFTRYLQLYCHVMSHFFIYSLLYVMVLSNYYTISLLT